MSKFDEGWQVRSLGELCEYARGLTYKKKDEVPASSTTVLRANNITLETGLLNFDELKHIDESISVPKSKLVRKGSLLVCSASGSKKHLGKTAFIEQDYGYAFGGFMGMITPSEELDPRYLYWRTRSKDYFDFIDGLSDGANINNLKFSQLSNFSIPYPPLLQQKQIVSLLDQACHAIDKAIANTERNLANAHELFESYLSNVFTERGEGWKAGKLSDLVEEDCSLSYGIVQPGKDVEGGLPVVRPTDLKQKVVGLEGLKRIDPVRADSYQRTILKGGDILICVRGETGKVSVAKDELAGANLTRGIVPVRFECSTVQQDLGYYSLISESVQKQVKEGTYGAALMQINIRDLREITIYYPLLMEEQEQIVLELDKLHESTMQLEATHQQKLSVLTELKQSILQKAFRGELIGKMVEEMSAA